IDASEGSPMWAWSWATTKAPVLAADGHPLYCSVRPLFRKPRQFLTWLTSAQGRSKEESSQSLPSKDWMPLTEPRSGCTVQQVLD
uniref:Uncharacterized protein n=1 Tax=Spermophilus dauricus TaxID=99837 RepID=A0A8C9QG88_SPEDA